MKRLKHLALFLMVSLILLVIVIFMLENQQSVIITLFGWSSAEVSVSICLMVVLLIGMVVGPLLGVALRSRRSLSFKRNI